VNNDTGYNTREDLLGSALHWAWDTATASIEATPNPNGQVSYFTAKMASTFGGQGATFRWDFGDGTPFTNAYTSATSGHTYAVPGTYTVRVEATNGLGTRVIGETTATVLPEFNTPASATFAALGDTYLQSAVPTANYGGKSFLYTRVDAAGNDILRILMAFNVSSISSMYPVEKAEVSVYLDAFSGGAVDGQLQAYEVTTAWAENTATWKAPWVKPGGDLVDTAVGGAALDKSMVGQWITLDVTPLVTKWAGDPASNHGLMLRLRKVSSITGYQFVSSENWVTANRPKLEVTYRKP
jgi:PKD repeat protein